ncbi:hypothetical protein GUJ93_ZPchr0005g14632 [Zizania palustris]|uniref:Uncharacterized protein n=1 Tax=Zizania palustris TaxID=103762 RepID=A0A8J5S1Z1_ZIZPA|nr:hypothetical protein GUJ93_ZPchr0005g14632 [Zizania palustris]
MDVMETARRADFLFKAADHAHEEGAPLTSCRPRRRHDEDDDEAYVSCCCTGRRWKGPPQVSTAKDRPVHAVSCACSRSSSAT